MINPNTNPEVNPKPEPTGPNTNPESNPKADPTHPDIYPNNNPKVDPDTKPDTLPERLPPEIKANGDQKKSDQEREDELLDKVGEASIESFPASDSPGWISKEPAKDAPASKKSASKK